MISNYRRMIIFVRGYFPFNFAFNFFLLILLFPFNFAFNFFIFHAIFF